MYISKINHEEMTYNVYGCVHARRIGSIAVPLLMGSIGCYIVNFFPVAVDVFFSFIADATHDLSWYKLCRKQMQPICLRQDSSQWLPPLLVYSQKWNYH